MNHSDEFEDRLDYTPRRDARAHRWVVPALGAVVGILVGLIIANLAAANVPDGDSWFPAAALILQTIGAAIGALIGAAVAARRREV